MPVSFRVAHQSDVDTIVPFRHELCANDPVPFDKAVTRRVITDLIDDPAAGRVWLILDGDEPIGYVVLCLGYSLEFGGRDGVVDELFICGNHRGRGVGRRALAHVEAAAWALGVQALHLEVDRGNTAAQRLYRRVGFADHDRYLMTKWLAPRG